MSNNSTPLADGEAAAILKQRLGGKVRELHVLLCADGIVLRGCAVTFHGKQLAQHLAHELTGRPVLANEIEVRATARLRDEGEQ